MSDVLYWIWMSRCLGVANNHFRDILKQLGTPYEVYRTEPEDLYRVQGITEKEVQALSNKRLQEASEIMEACTRLSIGILTYWDENYPIRLKSLVDPPMVLYYRGKLPAFDKHLCISIVGTRSMSASGQHIAYKMGYELASAGVIVVSGMALGIDGVATCGGIVGGGMVVAVMGCGLDRAYPSAHARLMNEVIAHGVAISEYPPGTEPAGENFPVRNRIISGLSQGVVIVEADMRSGAMITAEHALVQGRTIFATPGNLEDANAEGPNHLLAEGALIVLGAENILDYYDSIPERSLFSKSAFEIARAQKNIYEEESLARMNVSLRTYNPRQKAREESKKKMSSYEMRPPRKPTVHTEILIDTEAGRRGPVIAGRTFTSNPANFSNITPPVPEQAPPKVTEELLCRDPAEAELPELNEKLRKVLAAIPDDRSITLDKLMILGLKFGELHLALTELEAKGYIDSLPGNLYIRR